MPRGTTIATRPQAVAAEMTLAVVIDDATIDTVAITAKIPRWPRLARPQSIIFTSAHRSIN